MSLCCVAVQVAAGAFSASKSPSSALCLMQKPRSCRRAGSRAHPSTWRGEFVQPVNAWCGVHVLLMLQEHLVHHVCSQCGLLVLRSCQLVRLNGCAHSHHGRGCCMQV